MKVSHTVLNFLWIIVFVVTGGVINSQTCKCESVFEEVVYHVEHNYAGWLDKSKGMDVAAYEVEKTEVKRNAGRAETDVKCYDIIQQWLNTFKDGHLRIHMPESWKEGETIAKPIEIRRVTEEIESIRKRATSNSSNPLTGIWSDGTYELAVIEDGEHRNQYLGVVLISENENWLPGEVKCIITPTKGKEYSLKIISGSKDAEREARLFIDKNILNCETYFFENRNRDYFEKYDYEEYVSEHDPTSIRFDFYEDDKLVIRIPNLFGENFGVLKALLEKHESRMKTAKYWLIDMRGNEGGNVKVAYALLPYLYTQPIISYKTKFRVTSENYNLWFETYVSDWYQEAELVERAEFDSTIKLTMAHLGEWHNIYNNTAIADTLVFDSVSHQPEKVGILIDDTMVSSGELFCLLARQSTKVRMIGQPSSGMIDYGNVLTYSLKECAMTLQLPSDRYNWLDYGISIDRDKINPDFQLTEKEEDWIKVGFEFLSTQ